QPRTYAELIGGFSDADFRGEIDLFGGGKPSRGAVIVNMVLGGCAAYRTQLFLYLKSCGRDELNTMNLWAEVVAPMRATEHALNVSCEMVVVRRQMQLAKRPNNLITARDSLGQLASGSSPYHIAQQPSHIRHLRSRPYFGRPL